MTRAKHESHAKAEKHEPHPAPPLPVPPPHAPPPPEVDVPVCLEHLLTAIGLLARAAGSPPDVLRELATARALLGKES